ncbi:hypothetical protein RFI_21982, partial [Reticulomyxa filosa]
MRKTLCQKFFKVIVRCLAARLVVSVLLRTKYQHWIGQRHVPKIAKCVLPSVCDSAKERGPRKQVQMDNDARTIVDVILAVCNVHDMRNVVIKTTIGSNDHSLDSKYVYTTEDFLQTFNDQFNGANKEEITSSNIADLIASLRNSHQFFNPTVSIHFLTLHFKIITEEEERRKMRDFVNENFVVISSNDGDMLNRKLLLERLCNVKLEQDIVCIRIFAFALPELQDHAIRWLKTPIIEDMGSSGITFQIQLH